jgi:uncharacterized protein (DUF849 family)/GNAT superfamily N-acetyltransferase
MIINAALTGMVGTRDRVPALPLTADRIARDARIATQLGATILHLHARDADGRPDWRPETYAEVIHAVREACPDAVVCVSTSGREEGELERRAAVLGLEDNAKPDMASLTLGSLNFATGPSVNAAATVEALAERMLAAGVRPELEIFDSGMAWEAHRLLERGLLIQPLYANLMLGGHHTAPATLRELSHLVDSLPTGTIWATAGIGSFQFRANALAVFGGGHVRTGLEDATKLRPGDDSTTTNSALVRRVVDLAEQAGRTIANATETRALLGLPAGEGSGFSIRPARLPDDREAMLRVLEPANMHHVPSPEMDDFDVGTWFVAKVSDEIVGVAGYRILRDRTGFVGKTTLLAVLPEQRALGIGRALQELRMELMRDAGATRVITNADRPETIAWYERHFGYRQVGELPKEHEFGLPDVANWTTLEAALD